MKYIEDFDLKNKVVFIRADLNVPINKQDGTVADDNRIQASLPAIKYAVTHGAKVVVASHLGRPKGAPEAKYSLRPVSTRLSELLGAKVVMCNDCVGEERRDLIAKLNFGQVLLLENLRFHAGESDNDAEFSKKLADGIDIYINDAFATSHRAHASTAGMLKYIKEKGAGPTIRTELEFFNKAFDHCEPPLAVIFGGAKISTKLGAIKHVAKKADLILVGGAMANTILAARGYNIGRSLVEKDLYPVAKEIEAQLVESGCEFLVPVDVVVCSELASGLPTRVATVDDIKDNEMALDIGPKTLEIFQAGLAKAKTIIWNGPLGAFETPEFSKGTFGIIDTLVKSKALTVVGGGDTDLALHQAHALDKMGYVSTAGGAFLELLEGKKLPAIEALNE